MKRVFLTFKRNCNLLASYSNNRIFPMDQDTFNILKRVAKYRSCSTSQIRKALESQGILHVPAASVKFTKKYRIAEACFGVSNLLPVIKY